jgi:hypothetical protein
MRTVQTHGVLADLTWVLLIIALLVTLGRREGEERTRGSRRGRPGFGAGGTRSLLRERAGMSLERPWARDVDATLGQGRAQAVTKQRQPLDGLVAEDQPQVSRRDRPSPGIRHGRCGDLVVE